MGNAWVAGGGLLQSHCGTQGQLYPSLDMTLHAVALQEFGPSCSPPQMVSNLFAQQMFQIFMCLLWWKKCGRQILLSKDMELRNNMYLDMLPSYQ